METKGRFTLPSAGVLVSYAGASMLVCLRKITYRFTTCVLPVYHLCTTCVPPAYHLCNASAYETEASADRRVTNAGPMMFINYIGVVFPFCVITTVRSLIFSFLDDFEGNAKISVSVKYGPTVKHTSQPMTAHQHRVTNPGLMKL